MKIEHLIDKYFEGETTPADERMLREYFLGGNVQPEHSKLRHLFRFLEDEHASLHPTRDFDSKLDDKIARLGTGKENRYSRKYYYYFSGVAASIVILVSILMYRSEVAPKEDAVQNKSEKNTTTLTMKTEQDNIPAISGGTQSLADSSPAAQSVQSNRKIYHKTKANRENRETGQKSDIEEARKAMMLVADNFALAEKELGSLRTIDNSLNKIRDASIINDYQQQFNNFFGGF